MTTTDISGFQPGLTHHLTCFIGGFFMKRKVILLPVVLLCMVVFFSCDDTAEKKVNPGVLKNGVYTGPCVLNIGGTKFNGTSTLTVTVSGDSASGTAVSEFETLGTKNGSFSATSLGGGDYYTTLTVDTYTLTGNSSVTDDNVIKGAVNGAVGTVPATLSYNLTGQGMDDGGGSSTFKLTFLGSTFDLNNCTVQAPASTQVECNDGSGGHEIRMYFSGSTTGTYTNPQLDGMQLFGFDASVDYAISNACSDIVTINVTRYSNGGTVAGTLTGTATYGFDCDAVRQDVSATFSINDWVY